MQPKKFSEYTPITETDGTEVIPILKAGVNATVKSEDLPISTATQTAIDASDADIAAHVADVANPHQVTKAQVGLGSVDNTSDATKPVSTAQATAIALKADQATTYTKTEVDTKDATVASNAASALSTHTSNTSNPHSVTKTQVGLGNVDNTSDVNKPVSTAQATADGLRVLKDRVALNVKDFGAVGDGVANDYSPIQLAVNAARDAGGGIVYLPKGIYKIQSTITWYSGVSMVGDGPGSSILKMSGVLLDAISSFTAGPPSGGDPSTIPLRDCIFRDFEIDGSGLTSTAPSVSGKGIYILYMQRCKFINLYIHHCIGTGLGADFLDQVVMDGVIANNNGRNWDGVNMAIGQSGIGVGTNWKSVEALTITNCHALNNGNYGFFVEIQLTGGASNTIWPAGCRMVGCYAEGNRIGFGNRGSGGVTFDACEARNNLMWGFLSNQGSRGDVYSACIATGSGQHGFYFKDMYGEVDMSNCVAANNTWNGIRFDTSTTYPMQNIVVNACTVRNNGRQGIVFAGSTAGIINYMVSSCLVKDNGTLLGGATRQGIVLAGVVTDGMIIGNWIGNSSSGTTQDYGLQMLDTTTNLEVRANTFIRNTVTAQIGQSGTRTAVTIGRDNAGYKNYVMGTGSILNGNSNVTVTHGMVLTPTKVVVTPNSDVNVWPTTLGVSGIIFNRTGTTGQVDFTYIAEV